MISIVVKDIVRVIVVIGGKLLVDELFLLLFLLVKLFMMSLLFVLVKRYGLFWMSKIEKNIWNLINVNEVIVIFLFF